MASGDLTASTPTIIDTNKSDWASTLKTTIDALNLAASTDFLFIIPVGHDARIAVFKVQRAVI